MFKKIQPFLRGLATPFKLLFRAIRQQKKEPDIRAIRDHKLVKKKLAIDEVTNRKQDEQRIQELSKAKDGMHLIGEKEGNMNIPNPHVLEAPTIREWNARCKSILDEIIAQINYKVIEMEKHMQSMIATLEEQSVEELIEYHIAQRVKKAQRKLGGVFKRRRNQYSIQEFIDLITTEIREETAIINDLLKRVYHQIQPKKGITDYTFVYILLLLGITCGEYPLNVSSLVYLGELSNGFVLVLSGFFALILGFSAHAAGHAFFKKHTGEWIAAVGIGLAICAIVSILRAQLHGSLIMAFLNVLIFFFGCYASYTRAKNNAYFSSKRRIKKLQRKKRRLEVVQRRLTIEARAESEKEVKEQLDELKQLIDEENMALSMAKTYQQSILDRIDGIRLEGIAMYRNSNSLSRKQAGHPPVAIWEQDASKMNNQYHQSNQTSTGSYYKYTHFIVLLIAFWGLVSCGQVGSNEAVILFDITDPRAVNTVDLEKVPDYLLEEVLELSETDLKSQGLKVKVSSIGSTSIQYVEEVELEAGGSFLARTDKKREEGIDGFKTDLYSEIEKIAKVKKGLNQTVLMENLCGHLNTLAASNASKKTIILFSDLCQNTKSVSFYHYRNKPHLIMDNYETLAAKMDMLCPLPSLNGIDVYIIYLPTEATDELFQFTRAFFAKYLGNYGAEVTFSPNI
ncbi:MAG: hypothetical protein AAGG68_23550 [Bacteroidota bacterium]